MPTAPKHCMSFITSLNEDQRRLLASCFRLGSRLPINESILATRLADALTLAEAVYTIGHWPNLS